MTSLQLQPQPEFIPKVYPEWGSGKEKGYKGNLWTPAPPTWQYSGQPIEQHYDLTALKRSNVRLNDQLLPTPQTSLMQTHMIQRPFPAEHPYSSHIERKAVFPKFDSPSDPQRGVAARGHLPKHPEMPANGYDILVVSKAKGNALRREIQALPAESEKRALEWHSHGFDQDVKSAGKEHAPYYPWPPKSLVPNLEHRDDGICANGDLTLGKASAHVLRNVEKDQWTTTYDRAHTGLGPSNPYKLDNYDPGADPNAPSTPLTAGTVRTFDPPRPFDGRIAREFYPNPQPDQRFPAPERDPNYVPYPRRSDIEEDRLQNGTQYNSYQGPDRETYPSYPPPKLPVIAEENETPRQLSAEEQLHEDLAKAAVKQHHKLQQVEAQNRWKDLELQTPDHDLTALNHKLQLTNTKSQPKVFYDHESKYREERAGLYLTSYQPPKPQVGGADSFDTSQSHKNALNLDLDLNGEMHNAIRFNRTLGGNDGSVSRTHPQPTPYEAFEPFNIAKNLQKKKLEPTNPDFRVQEGHINVLETSYGREFNIPTFLQERQMPTLARQEPIVLMSHENQNLENSRMVSNPAYPKITPPHPVRPQPASLVTGEPIDLHRPRTAPDLLTFSNRYSYQNGTPETSGTPGTGLSSSLPLSLSARTPSRGGRSGAADLMPLSARPFDSSRSQRNGTGLTRSFDLSFKDDERFNYKVGCGTPRPQTTLLQIQDAFSKTGAKTEFLARFPEQNPDLRENIIRGKKHDFAGFNAQVLRGTPVLA